MVHGVLKNADAQKMAQEIVEMLDMKIQLQQNDDLQQQIEDFKLLEAACYDAMGYSPDCQEGLPSLISKLKARLETLAERNHELEQKELLRSASRPAEAEAMRNVLEESERLKAQLGLGQPPTNWKTGEKLPSDTGILVSSRENYERVMDENLKLKSERDDLKVELFKTEHTNKLVSNENRALTEERDKLKERLDASEKACAAVRQYSHKVSAIGYKEGVVGSHVLMLLEEHGKGYFTPEQVGPLLEALRKVEGFGSSDMGHQNMCDYVTEAAQEALAHARAVGIAEEKI